MQSLRNLLERVRRYFSPFKAYIWLLCCTVISLAISIGMVEIDLRLPHDPSFFAVLLTFLLLSGSLFVPIIAVGLSIYTACQWRDRANSLGVLLAAYLAIILCFTGFYYSVIYIDDYNDCVNRYFHFEAEFAMSQYDSQRPILDPPDSERAFNGIRHRLWQLGKYNDTVSDEIHNIQRLISHDFDEIIHPVQDSKLPVFIDCLHFSVVSMTLFGYGTVTPLVWTIKLANSVQVLTGTLLLAVLLGLLFANRGNEDMERKELTNKPYSEQK